MAKYCVFDSTNMRATHFAERIFDCVSDEDIENGTFGYLGELADRNIYKFVKGAKDGEAVVVVNQPAWTEDTCRTSNQRRDKFIIPAGTPFRVFAVHEGDEFGITIEGISSATQNIVGSETDFAANDVFLTIGTDGKLVASTTAPAVASGDDVVELDGSTTTGQAAFVPMVARIERKRMMGATLVTPLREYGYANAMYEARIKVLA